MKTTLTFISIILFVGFISCEKGSQFNMNNSDGPLLIQVLDNGKLFLEYNYSEADLINEEKNKLHYTKYNYNNKNQLTSADFYVDPGMYSNSLQVVQAAYNRTEWVNADNTAKSLTITFGYDGSDRISRFTYYRPTESNGEFIELIYDENNKIIVKTTYWHNVISYYTEFVYDERGNLIKETRYRVPSTGITDAELLTTTEYEFDNMKNPYYSRVPLRTPGENTNPNNIIKETYTIHFEVDVWTQKVTVAETAYDYNKEGYPILVNGETEYVYE
jgi:hypothetical protein